MSVRLKGLLAGSMQSRRELSYLREHQVEKFEDFPCEMTFEATGMYLEHESQAHHYLPYFRLTGYVSELRGDFPYGISSVYFGEEDKPELSQDIFYYPTPDELAYLIQHAGFYSQDFEMSSILKNNEYNLPVKVDLSVIPPEDEDMYVRMTRSQEDVTMLAGMDKSNIPIVYADIKGSGVDKTNDKTVAYYGLDFEQDFPLMVMTAEASGYTDPPLISRDYWPEAVHKQADEAVKDMSDYYITPEEEAELMRLEAEKNKEPDRTLDLTPEAEPASYEDQLIAKADRQIASRMRARTKQQEDLRMERRKAAEDERAAERVVDEPVQSVREEQADYQSDGYLSLDEDGVTPVQDFGQAGDFIPDEKLGEPDMPQQQAEVKMDLDPHGNAYVEAEREESTEDDLLEADESELMRMESADVADAEDQAKVNEANARETARDAAIEDMRDRMEEDKEHRVVGTKTDTSRVHRSVPESMSEIADAYDAQHLNPDDPELS